MAMIKRVLRGIIRRVDKLLDRPISVKIVKVPVRIPVFQNELLKGRRAFITGGAKGIGKGIAEAYLRSGCEVVITGRTEESLRTAVAELSTIGPRVGYAVIDNSHPHSFSVAIDKVISDFGIPDILVNNAGVTRSGDLADSTEESCDAVFDSVLKGAWFMSQEFAMRWRKLATRANILNICSTSSFRPGYSPYVLCKWGERAMTIGLAKRLLPNDIVVNGLAPGVTNVDRLVPNKEEGIAHPSNPSGRYVTVEEVANMAVVLVSDLARMIVGDVVVIGGGGAIITIDD